MPELVHATAIAFGARGVLLRGASGSGKSDLALRCIGLPCNFPPGPATLVADDQVLVEILPGGVFLSPPPTIAGLLEVRGVGVVQVPYAASARLELVVDLVTADQVDRMPVIGPGVPIAGVQVPAVRLTAFEASAQLKVALALDQVRADKAYRQSGHRQRFSR